MDTTTRSIPTPTRHPSLVAWAALALASALLASGCERDTVLKTDTEESMIYVSGSGSVTAVPDMADADIGVQTFASTADSAASRNSELTAAVIAAIRGLGVDSEDIQTSHFSLWPQRDYGDGRETPVIVGFWASNSVNVRIRILSTAGEVLQGAIDAGANMVNGLQFTVSTADSLRQEARALAVADARNKAEVLAESASADLGPVHTIRETSGSYPIFARGEFDEASGSVPVEPGELDVIAQVEVVFLLE